MPLKAVDQFAVLGPEPESASTDVPVSAGGAVTVELGAGLTEDAGGAVESVATVGVEAGGGIGASNDGTDDEVREEVVVVESSPAWVEAGGERFQGTAGVLVAGEPSSVWEVDDESVASETTATWGSDVGVDEATTSTIGWVVPPLTVSCSLGEAKECQSKTTSEATGVGRFTVKPVEFTSLT
jgi:hypothetical protein